MLKSSRLLHSKVFGNFDSPHIVFLHGFLGNGSDWQCVINKLSKGYYCIVVDLPGHGASRDIKVSDLNETVQLVEHTINALNVSEYLLVGYSMGARIAALGAVKKCFSSVKGVVLEGANLGGLTPKDKNERLKSDLNWCNQFSTRPLLEVLNAWYQQPLFASLQRQIKNTIINKRAMENGGPDYCNVALGKMLLASTLARQDNLIKKIASLDIPIQYIVGEFDNKFCRLAQEYKIPLIYISQSGHNTHIENADEFSQALIAFYTNIR